MFSESKAMREVENKFVPILLNCKTITTLKKIHASILKLSLSQSNFLVTKMLDICDNNRDTTYANLLFTHVSEPNVFLYNAIIRTHTHNCLYARAIELYKLMLRHSDAQNSVFPDKFTFPFVVKACAGLGTARLGSQVHGNVWKFGGVGRLVTDNALIDMYCKCDRLGNAQKVFDGMFEKDVISWNSVLSGYVRLGFMRNAKELFEEMDCKSVVSWTAMISGFTRVGSYSDALDVFREMQVFGIEPDEISIVSVLPACAESGALELGKWIHLYSERKGFLRVTPLCNALIEMYAKCGCIQNALRLFDQMNNRDVISWSTMISGLAQHGKPRESIQLFGEMQRQKVEPNAITFLGLLSACTHAGYLERGLEFFDSMREAYGLEPDIEHYGCLVDLLGRGGHLDQALETIMKMPMEPDSKIWGSLLSSCRTFNNLEIAIIAMEHLQKFEPDDTGNYVLLSNIYANLGKWEGVSAMRKLIRSKSMKKTPGCSSIEVDNVVEEFISGDNSKPFSKDICLLLKLLTSHQDKFEDLVDIVAENEIQLLN